MKTSSICSASFFGYLPDNISQYLEPNLGLISNSKILIKNSLISFEFSICHPTFASILGTSPPDCKLADGKITPSQINRNSHGNCEFNLKPTQIMFWSPWFRARGKAAKKKTKNGKIEISRITLSFFIYNIYIYIYLICSFRFVCEQAIGLQVQGNTPFESYLGSDIKHLGNLLKSLLNWAEMA